MRPGLQRIFQNTRARALAQRIAGVPLLRGLQSRASAVIAPRDSSHWVQIPQGPNRGFEMLVDVRAELGYLRGDHEPWIARALKEWLPAGGTYLDVGSHVGYFALAASSLVGTKGNVIALEPDPESFQRLSAQVRRNGLTNIRMVRAAAWSDAGTVRFASSLDADTGARGAVVDRVSATIDVDAVTLDDLVRTTTPDVIKIDVEGGEMHALAGASRLIELRSVCWLVEIHSEELRAQVTSVFDTAGYEVIVSTPTHALYADYVQTYVIAVPPQKYNAKLLAQILSEDH